MAAATSSPTPSGTAAPTRWPSSSASTRGSRSFLLQVSKPSPVGAANKQQPAPAVVRCRRPVAAAALPVPETAAACVAAAGLVGVAATFLVGRPPAPAAAELSAAAGEEQNQQRQVEEVCSDCGGTGLCPRCKGEGFVFKQLPEDAASRARKAAKNMATRYTAGLPTKWTYCNRCSSTRSCTTCGGSGSITATKPPPTN